METEEKPSTQSPDPSPKQKGPTTFSLTEEEDEKSNQEKEKNAPPLTVRTISKTQPVPDCPPEKQESGLPPEKSIAINHSTFTTYDLSVSSQEELTLDYLTSDIIPYLEAVAEIQRIIDEATGRPYQVKLHSIKQGSITATVSGIAQAVQIIAELVIPWKRKHTEKMAKLLEAEKRASIQKSNAEKLEIEVRTTRGQEEAKIQQLKAERMRLENEKLRVELQREKIPLVFEFLEHINPDLSDEDRSAYALRALPRFETIISSPLNLAPITLPEPS